jgi:hypothetical protein
LFDVFSSVKGTLYVHIGTHKTGTTSVQSFLRLYTERLRECGICVPKSGTYPDAGHHNIAWEIRNDPRYEPSVGGVEALVNELSNSTVPQAVISSEDFEYMSQYPTALKQFDECIESHGYNTRYIVYFRDPHDYVRSLYCELRTSGLPEGYEEFRASAQGLGFCVFNGDWFYDFRRERFLDTWKSIVGPKISSYSYDEVIRGTGLLPSFLMAIGADEDIVHESRKMRFLNTRIDKFEFVCRQRDKLAQELSEASARIKCLESKFQRE